MRFDSAIKNRYETYAERRDDMRRIPQYGVSVYEALLYLTLPFLLIMAGAMPTSAIIVMPIVLTMLYGLYRRFGIVFPLSVIFGYGLFALVLNYDILTVVYSVGLFIAFIGLTVSQQINGGYLAAAVTACVVAMVGAFIGVGIVRLVEDKPVGEVAKCYITAESNDPVISFFARDYYDDVKLPADEIKLGHGDDGYADAAIEHFSEWAKDEFEYYIWYYCIHFGAVIGAVGYFAAIIIGRRTASCYDACVTEKELRLSTRSLGGARVCETPLAEMRMPRSYLWACLLPAAIAAIILEFVGGYDALTATVMHLFVTLPSAFTFFTCMAFFASLFKGRAKYAANAVLVLIGTAMVMFPIVLFFCSVVGVCDCILNLRFWTRFIMED